MIQILVGVFVGEDHRDQGDGRNAHHVPGRGDGRTGQGNQASGDERGRTTEKMALARLKLNANPVKRTEVGNVSVR